MLFRCVIHFFLLLASRLRCTETVGAWKFPKVGHPQADITATYRLQEAWISEASPCLSLHLLMRGWDIQQAAVCNLDLWHFRAGMPVSVAPIELEADFKL